MAEDSDLERTEEPTQRRRDDARREGRVPRSPELLTALLFLSGAAVLNGATGSFLPRMGDDFGAGLRGLERATGGIEGLLPALESAMRTALTGAAVLAASVAAGALAIGAAQARGVLTFEPVTPQWARLDPLANVRRMLGVATFVELAKSLIKLAIVGIVAWRLLDRHAAEFAGLTGGGPIAMLFVIKSVAIDLLRDAGFAYLGFAAADYGWQLWRHQQELRMTKAEVREELRRQEGDLALKARIRAIARSKVQRRMMQDVPRADVVIVNPTHVAVALRYDPLSAPAPVVLAMGERLIAQRIRDIATSHGVPIIENRPLARALLASARVGSVIPAELYVAVAEVLAFVFRTRQRRLGGVSS